MKVLVAARVIWPLLACYTDRKSIRQAETSLAGRLQIQHPYSMLGVELVRNAGRIVKAFRFDQNDLQLQGRRVDVHDLIAVLFDLLLGISCAAADCRQGKTFSSVSST